MSQVTRKDDLGTLTDLGASIRLTDALLTIGGRQYKIDQLDANYPVLVNDTIYKVYATAVSQSPALVVDTVAPVTAHIEVGSFLYKNSTISISETGSIPLASASQHGLIKLSEDYGASDTDSGLVKANKIQKKTTSATHSTSASGVFTFSNLDTSKLYKITIVFGRAFRGAANGYVRVLAMNNSVNILSKASAGSGLDDGGSYTETVSAKAGLTFSNYFQPSGGDTGLSIDLSIGGASSQLLGLEAILEELNNTVETVDFT